MDRKQFDYEIQKTRDKYVVVNTLMYLNKLLLAIALCIYALGLVRLFIVISVLFLILQVLEVIMFIDLKKNG